MLFVPIGSPEPVTVNVAVESDGSIWLTVAVASKVAPSMKLTVPVGAGPPEAPVTVANRAVD